MPLSASMGGTGRVPGLTALQKRVAGTLAHDGAKARRRVTVREWLTPIGLQTLYALLVRMPTFRVLSCSPSR